MSGEVAAHRLVLSESRRVRLFSFFLFYFGQGLPLGVSQIAFPAWLVANGADQAAVAAIIATAFLPWSFKFIPAAMMDRYSFLAMGRRRAWLIAAQLLMVAGFVVASIIAPSPGDLATILYVVLLIGTGSAIQDVAVDGLAVDILPEAEQGAASAWMFGGQSVGKALSGALAGVALQYWGSQTTFLLFLLPILLITTFAVWLRERPGERRFPWSEGEASPVNLERHAGAWWPILRVTLVSLLRGDSLKLIAASGMTRTALGMMTTLWPIIGGAGYAGFGTASYSSMISLVGLLTAVAGIGVGSALTSHFGPRKATVLVVLNCAILALATLYGQTFWLTAWVFIALSCWQELIQFLSSACSNPMRMQLSDPQVAATQFTIYNSLSNLPVSLGATLFAVMGGTGQLPLVMWTMTGFLLGGAALFSWIQAGSRHQATEPAPLVN